MRQSRFHLLTILILFATMLVSIVGMSGIHINHKSLEQLFHKELERYFANALSHTQLIFDAHHDQLKQHVAEINTPPMLLASWIQDPSHDAMALQMLLTRQMGERLDLLMLVSASQKEQALFEHHTLDDLTPLLAYLKKHPMDHGLLYGFRTASKELLFLLHSKPLLDPQSGEVLAFAIGGVELLHDTMLYSLLQRSTKMEKIALFYEPFHPSIAEAVQSITALKDTEQHYLATERITFDQHASPLLMQMRAHNDSLDDILELVSEDISLFMGVIVVSIVLFLSLLHWLLVRPIGILHTYAAALALERKHVPHPLINVSEYDALAHHLHTLFSKLQQSQHTLLHVQQKNEEILHIVDSYVIISSTDLKGVITDVSHAFCQISGYDKHELIGHTFALLRDPHFPSSSYEPLWKALIYEDTWEGELCNIRKNGERFWHYVQITSRYEEGQKVGYTAIHHDITDKKRSEWLATTDQLTGLYNRRYLEQTLRQEALRFERYGDPMSVCMVDIDHFKVINDTYGHHEGDAVLIKIAHFLKLNCRESDIVGRWGGEEFLIILPKTTLKEGEKVAEKIREYVSLYHFENMGYQSVSIGVAAYAHSVDSSIQHADKALYRAKENGRNRVEVYKS